MTTNQALIALALLPVVTMVSAAAPRGDRWTDEEVAQLSSLSLGELGAPPPDPTNRVADDPHAAEFGRKLFFDTRLSVNGRVSCARPVTFLRRRSRTERRWRKAWASRIAHDADRRHGAQPSAQERRQIEAFLRSLRGTEQ